MFRAPSIDAHPYIELSSPTVLSTFSPSRLNNDSNRARDRPPPSPVVSVASRLGSPLCGEFCFTHLRVIGDPDRRDVAFHLGPLVRGHVFQSLNHCARASRSRFNRRRQSIAFASLSIVFVFVFLIHPSSSIPFATTITTTTRAERSDRIRTRGVGVSRPDDGARRDGCERWEVSAHA